MAHRAAASARSPPARTNTGMRVERHRQPLASPGRGGAAPVNQSTHVPGREPDRRPSAGSPGRAHRRDEQVAAERVLRRMLVGRVAAPASAGTAGAPSAARCRAPRARACTGRARAPRAGAGSRPRPRGPAPGTPTAAACRGGSAGGRAAGRRRAAPSARTSRAAACSRCGARIGLSSLSQMPLGDYREERADVVADVGQPDARRRRGELRGERRAAARSRTCRR